MDSTEFRLRDELGAAHARIEELQRKLDAAGRAAVLAQHAAVLAEREARAGELARLTAIAEYLAAEAGAQWHPEPWDERAAVARLAAAVDGLATVGLDAHAAFAFRK